MTKTEIARETRKQRRLEILGTQTPRCGTCGFNRWQAIERHHPIDHHRQPDTTVLECRNCHRILSDDQKDHPAPDPGADPLLDNAGNLMLGLADMQRITAEKLYEFGIALIERAAPLIPERPT